MEGECGRLEDNNNKYEKHSTHKRNIKRKKDVKTEKCVVI